MDKLNQKLFNEVTKTLANRDLTSLSCSSKQVNQLCKPSLNFRRMFGFPTEVYGDCIVITNGTFPNNFQAEFYNPDSMETMLDFWRNTMLRGNGLSQLYGKNKITLPCEKIKYTQNWSILDDDNVCLYHFYSAVATVTEKEYVLEEINTYILDRNIIPQAYAVLEEIPLKGFPELVHYVHRKKTVHRYE